MDSKLFDRLLESTRQMDAIVRGRSAPSRTFEVTPEDVQAIRKKTGLSQSNFAQVLDVNVGTLRNWEQGQRRPSGPARVLLRALRARPEEVLSAIREDAERSSRKRASTKSPTR